jgi:hypothetical protein
MKGENYMSYLSPKFLIGSVKIGSIEGASCFNMGNNFPNNFTNHKKHNQGFGSVTGHHNDIKGILSKLDDSDQLDMVNDTNYKETPEWIKEFIVANLLAKEAEDNTADDLENPPPSEIDL